MIFSERGNAKKNAFGRIGFEKFNTSSKLQTKVVALIRYCSKYIKEKLD